MEQIREQFIADLEQINDQKSLEELKNKYFSKKGLVTGLMGKINEVEDKKAYGKAVNDLKQELYALYSEREEFYKAQKFDAELLSQAVDVTLESNEGSLATKNILLKTQEEIENFFIKKGFELVSGSEVESDYYNFTALNLDEYHPARDMQDTFYIDEQILLRTHTTNTESRLLKKYKNEELQFICSGKVYRRDDDDATHSHQFMQLEGFCVVDFSKGHHANLQDLKSLLNQFVKTIFNNDALQIRLRPSYFPFTEPSFEVDVSCTRCMGKGCRFCKQTGWIEILGAGILDKSVLKHAGFDTDRFGGYAFGIGVERICLLKHQIDDIRHLYTNDIRFIKQF